MKRSLLSLLLAFSMVGFAACGGGKDYLVVVDTSGSMQARDTLKRVKASMPKVLENIKNGDTVSLMHFDAEAKMGSTTKVEGDADRAKIKAEVDALKAEGAYTDMARMLMAVQEKVKSMKDAGKTAHVIVLSDGLDDPKLKRGKLDLGKYRDQQGGPINDAFIYYISLGEISNPALEAQLKELSPQTKTYLAGNRVADSKDPNAKKPGEQTTPEQALTNVGEDVQKNNWLSYVKQFAPYVIGLILLVLLILFIIWLVKRLQRGDALYGNVLYYPEGIQFPNRNTFTLNKIGMAALTIGSKQGNRLRIKDLGTTETFSFKGKKVGPNMCLRPLGKSARNIQFTSQRQQGLISPGDRFRIGEYSFVFNDEES
ncbi:MAG: VWA domain-containing protein [Spirochaetia bacterium]|nr:VWA domain-containing protein [Spirochaetia bacterium]